MGFAFFTVDPMAEYADCDGVYIASVRKWTSGGAVQGGGGVVRACHLLE